MKGVAGACLELAAGGFGYSSALAQARVSEKEEPNPERKRVVALRRRSGRQRRAVDSGGESQACGSSGVFLFGGTLKVARLAERSDEVG